MFLFMSVPTNLDTWSGLEADKTVLWPSGGLHHLGKFLESWLMVEEAVVSCCGNIVGHFWLIWNEL